MRQEYDAMVDFKPIMSLPEIEVKTGEEEEEKLFGERAKLYRMDGSQWKVRMQFYCSGIYKKLVSKFAHTYELLLMNKLAFF